MSSTSRSSSTQTATIPGMGQQERDIVNTLQGVGADQASALKLAMQMAQQNDPFSIAIDLANQALIDQSFAGAQSNLQRQANIMGQELAGTRGLNTSDTPVSEAVLREMLPQMQQLESQRAAQSLGLGMNLAMNKAQLGEGRRQFNLSSLLQGTQATPSAYAGLANRFQNERFANATTNVNSKYTPSIMSSIGQGIGLGSSLGAMGMGMMGGGLPGLGSFGATTSSYGPTTMFKQGGYDFSVNTPGR